MSIVDKSKVSFNDIQNYLSEEKWSNAVCCGYLILACENLGYDGEEIALLLHSLHDVFNRLTTDQAKRKYIDY